jgi:uncharacterized membrane protein YkvA (DUF1232 family)
MLTHNLEITQGRQRTFAAKHFLQECKCIAARIPFVLDAVAMYYCSIDQKTPLWAKGVALAALAYLLNPFDAVHDAIPLLGFSDDASAIVAALSAIGRYVTDEHKRLARMWAGMQDALQD